VREAAGALVDNGRTGHFEYKIVILLIDNVRELIEIRINFLCLKRVI
jgi:hypothetical protein